MAGSMSRANARQSAKRKGYYKSQAEKTPINRLIAMARHILRFNDTKTLDRLKQRPAIDKSRAAKVAPSSKLRALLATS